MSDHDLVFCTLNFTVLKEDPILITSRDFENLDYSRFKADLSSIPWDNIYDKNTIDEGVDFLTGNILTFLDLHAPFRIYKITKNYFPWVTHTLRDMIRTRNTALTKFKKSKNISDWNIYKSLINVVTAAIRKEKKIYFKGLLKKDETSGRL